MKTTHEPDGAIADRANNFVTRTGAAVLGLCTVVALTAAACVTVASVVVLFPSIA